MSDVKDQTYKLDIPVKIEPGCETRFTIMPKGLFKCQYVHLEGKMDHVVVLSMQIHKREQLSDARKNPMPTEFFDGTRYLDFETCAPGCAIDFLFRNDGKKKAEFFIFLTGKEVYPYP